MHIVLNLICKIAITFKNKPICRIYLGYHTMWSCVQILLDILMSRFNMVRKIDRVAIETKIAIKSTISVKHETDVFLGWPR